MANKKRPFLDGRKKDKPGSGLVQIWPSVPEEVRREAETVAGTNLAANLYPRDPNSVFRDWLCAVLDLRRANSPAEARKAIARLRGKPLAVREVVLVPEGIRGPRASVAEIDGKPLALPKDGAL